MKILQPATPNNFRSFQANRSTQQSKKKRPKSGKKKQKQQQSAEVLELPQLSEEYLNQLT